ncbi:MAG: S1C family serine protease [Clostridia bacterium]
MSKENWYQNDSWYAPLQRPEPPAAAPVKKKKKTWPWILGVVLLSLAIVVGLSLALREEQPEIPELPEIQLPHGAERGDKGEKSGDSGNKKSEKPSFREFFDSLYPVEDNEVEPVNIPRGQAEGDFRMELVPEEDTELELRELYERCSPSVVGIAAYTDGQIGYGWGSGVILSEDGLIITNTHVVAGADRATVTLYDNSEYEAVLIGADSISDIAVLKIEAAGLPAAVFGDSATLAVGQKVAAIGNPLGEDFRMTLTDGIISAISRDVNYKGRSMTLMQTNAALNEGNSGGPLFNLDGQVIGITNMKMMSSASTVEGIGFAIPSSTVLGVVNGILQDGKVVGRASIGITIGPIPDSAIEEYGLPAGLYIVTVSPGSDAEAKGLKAGDILLTVNGQPVTETKQVADIKDQFGVGDELYFRIWRDGKTFEVAVALVDTNDVYG